MPEFDYEWEVQKWDRKDDEGAFGTVRTPSGDTMGISIRIKLTLEWVWLNTTAEADRIAKNEGDGLKGRYRATDDKSGQLEVRLPPSFEDWRDGNFGIDYGFALQPGLVPHVGDRIHIEGVDCGELYSSHTAMMPLDYPLLSLDEFFEIERSVGWCGLEVLAARIGPVKLAEIWPQIQTSPKSNPKTHQHGQKANRYGLVLNSYLK